MPASFLNKRTAQWVYSLLPWFVLASTLGITLLAWKLAHEHGEDKARKEFESRAAQLEFSILSSMKAYEQILLGAKGFFLASNYISREEWRNYVEIQHLEDNYPGLLGMGYAEHISPSALKDHERQIRDSGFENYSVWPAGPRSEYSSIIYLEPFSGRNLRAFGYDMLSEPVRREAMQRAQATGKASLSGKVRLVQEGDRQEQAGSILYVPVYRQMYPAGTALENRAKIKGWVYQPFRMDDLMHGLLPRDNLALGLEIFDGSPEEEHLLFSSVPLSSLKVAPRYSMTRSIPLYGQEWVIHFHSTPAFDATMESGRPQMIALAGAIISLLCFGLTGSLARTHRKALSLAKAMTLELSESEHRFREMFDYTPIAYQSLDLLGHFIDVNERLCEMLGYTREELLRMSFDELWVDTHRHEFSGTLNEFVRKGTIENELELTRKDGTRITVILVGQVQRDHDGRFVRTHCILTDITARKRMELDLQQSQERLKQATSAGKVGLWDWDLITNRVDYSAEYKRQIGYRENELEPTFEVWVERLHPEDRPHALAAVQAHNEDPIRHPFLVEFRFRHKDGSYRWIESRGMTLFNESGEPVRMMGSHIDVTERHEKDELLKLSRVVFESTAEGILVTDADGTIVMVNPAFTAISGYTAEEALGKKPSILSSGHHESAFFKALWDSLHLTGSWHGEIANRHKSGRHYLEWLSISAVTNTEGKITHYVGIFTDITERKEGEERMRYLAHYDALTGLPNRTLLLDRLQQAMAQIRREHGRMAVLFLDLDRFKPVNDQHGHETGDRLLCEVAKRLHFCMRESDTIGRLGGDEFVMLLQGIENEQDAILVARKVIETLEQPFDLGSETILISASIGIALYPDHSTDESMLIKMADIAMYAAKNDPDRHYRVYNQGMLEPSE